MSQQALILNYRSAMNLRVAPYSLALALLGGTLVLWGAKAAVLSIPLSGELNLFSINKIAAWTLCFSTLIAVIFGVIQPRWLAWAAMGTSTGAIISLSYTLMMKVKHLKDLGAPGDMIDQTLTEITVKPGAVAVLSGLTILAVGIGMKRR
jgi:hypothetical protein